MSNRRSRHPSPYLLFVLALGLTAGLGAAAPAAEPPAVASDLPGVFGEVVEVRVINIEVVVTDADGVRVTGLGRDEFRLLVDGEPVPIDYFTEVRGGTAIGGGAEAVPDVAPGAPVGTSYLVFIDNLFSIARDRDRVLRKLQDDLGALGPEDRMALVAYDGRDLEMITSWSSSPEALRRAIDQAVEMRAHGLERLVEQRRYDFNALLEFSDALNGGSLAVERAEPLGDYLDPEERFYAGQLADQVQRSVAAATATLRSFAAPPGRKVMLLLSGGWPFLPAEFVVADYSRPIFLEPGIASGDDLFRTLADNANLVGYTIYPVDVPGFEAQTVDISQFQRPRTQGAGQAFGSGFLRERENHASLEFVAEATGGKAMINSARDEAFRRAVEDTRSYYWLGFTPQREGDDRRHDVVVETVDPALRVRSRGGYLDSSRQREVTMQVESALLFGNPPSNDPLLLTFGRPEKAGWGKMDLPLSVGIPAGSITFLPGVNASRVAQLELRVAVIDQAGRQADVPVLPVAFELAEAPPPGELLRYDTVLEMRREEHRVVVAIYDVASGRILSGSAEISP